MTELLPCPFCGANGTPMMDSHIVGWAVFCNRDGTGDVGVCDAIGPVRPTKAEAIDAWNTRTAAEITAKDIVLKLLASFTLCDHMGDAWAAIATAAKMVGIDMSWDDNEDLQEQLAFMGITSVYGVSLSEEE